MICLNLAIFPIYTNVPMEEFIMTWFMPKVTEIAVGLEINSYACAEV